MQEGAGRTLIAWLVYSWLTARHVVFLVVSSLLLLLLLFTRDGCLTWLLEQHSAKVVLRVCATSALSCLTSAILSRPQVSPTPLVAPVNRWLCVGDSSDWIGVIRVVSCASLPINCLYLCVPLSNKALYSNDDKCGTIIFYSLTSTTQESAFRIKCQFWRARAQLPLT